ncbi:ferredoxin-NADPH reductase [Actinoplanes utahensis]|uniref:ferredoxin-NADPH reductase n=1 Tax=Actinoplanes utahensis TaxID=1869 RepID=UPI001269D5B2|nr:ferredoxin-NADPH reductase [Actinoplanes utahensis]
MHLALVTNLMLAVACAPLLAVVLLTDPGRTWPLLVLFAPLGGPALVAAFTVLTAYPQGVVRTFWNAWRVCARRALTAATIACAALLVLGVDASFFGLHETGALLLPVIVVAMTLVVVTTLLVLVALAEHPGIRLRDAARAGLFLAVRRWYLSLFSLLVLVVFEALLAARPAIAIGVAASPLLYIILANSRFTLASLAPPLGRTT